MWISETLKIKYKSKFNDKITEKRGRPVVFYLFIVGKSTEESYSRALGENYVEFYY